MRSARPCKNQNRVNNDGDDCRDGDSDVDGDDDGDEDEDDDGDGDEDGDGDVDVDVDVDGPHLPRLRILGDLHPPSLK